MEQSLQQILILFCHPRFEQSRVNRALLDAARGVPTVLIHDLYETYPDFNIQVGEEQRLLRGARIIIWQHPLYMYGAPALLKQWLDLVLEFGWAHGSGGNVLKDKFIFNTTTTGGTRESYQHGGRNRFSLREFLVPFNQIAALCQMIYLPPFAVQGTYLLTDVQLQHYAASYRTLLEKLSHMDLSAKELQKFAFLNDWLAPPPGGTI